MSKFSGFALFAALLSFISPTFGADCTSSDYGQHVLPCDIKSRTRSIVYYLKNAKCDPKGTIPKPVDNIPCDCSTGQGLKQEQSGSITPTCEDCNPGFYSAGGDFINDWYRWTVNGTVPPADSGIITYCDTHRTYIKRCSHWKASVDNLTIESGDNKETRCLSSVLLLTKTFVLSSNKVSFEFRVEGRKCISRYLGCDGLAFFVDGKQVMEYVGSNFHWKIFNANLTSGTHTLKWIYRKNCYGFTHEELLDKAFIRSITLQGVDEPKATCNKCPPGSYSNKNKASQCTLCPYFQFQPESGQTSCKVCPPDTYSTMGATKCFPLPNCTKDDIIEAPGNPSTCSRKTADGPVVSSVYPQYLNVAGFDRSMLCKPRNPTTGRKDVPCTCQPGYELKPMNGDNTKFQCTKCKKGLYSKGTECNNCPSGQVALSGKHYHFWFNSSLPDGFTAACSGDCGVKNGWIPSGRLIRTGHVIGNLDSYLQTPNIQVESTIAEISFNCSIMCNITNKKGLLFGEHLANIRDCNLVFQVLNNGSIQDEVNCTSPKGSYHYQHQRRRDGQKIQHVYPLRKGNYTFRWMFHQTDQSRAMKASFEAKLWQISIIGVKDGEAFNCTTCRPGLRSNSGDTDCSVCPKGTYSKAGAKTCTNCPKGTFAYQNTSGECLKCGANTESLPTRDGCTVGGCVYSPKSGVKYNLTALSRPGGPMFEVLYYQPSRQFIRIRPPRLTIYPPHGRSFYLNLCTLDHENSSCVERDRFTGVATSIPTMACRTTWWWSRDSSIGRVIGYSPADGDIGSGLTVKLLHGDKCGGVGDKRWQTIIKLECDMEAGVGNPGPVNNYTDVYRRPCSYLFLWRSLYACPVCNPEDVEKVYSECVNGTRKVTYLKNKPCVGEANVEKGFNETCSSGGSVDTKVQPDEKSSTYKILIGVGVVVIVALIVVAAVFFYKHRQMKYRYYSSLARNKPMSRLAEEDEDHIIDNEENMYNSVRT